MANAKKLTNIIIKVLKNRGLSPTHAMISAKALINAELVGAHSHGLSRLKMYCDRIDTVSYTHLTLPTNDRV